MVFFVGLPAGALSACGSDDDDGGGSGGGARCHCEWGDSCDEYASGCGFQECESDGMNVKASGACSQEDVIGTCTCASEDLVTYYRSGTSDPQSQCEFWCDDGVYAPR
jgi:hypothetical protein